MRAQHKTNLGDEIVSETLGSNEMLHTALGYAARGWRVFPLHAPDQQGNCSCGKANCHNVGKHPRTPRGFHDATTDEATIRQWWGRWEGANIGIATGAGSNLAVLDVDPKNGGDASLAELPDMPPTLVVETGGGGFHFYYTYPPDGLGSGANVLGAGLDIRADGGYVVAPPSIHASGRRYSTREGRTEPSSMGWLYTFIKSRREQPRKQEGGRLVATSGAKRLVAKVSEGGRNEFLFKEAARLRHYGYEPEEIEGALQAVNERRCEPPLDEDEVRAIAESTERYEPEEQLVPVSLEDELNLIQSAGEFLSLEFPEEETRVFGLFSGELGMVQAKPNVGKTTMMMNLGVSAATGRAFEPLLEEGRPRRVLYLDFENRDRFFKRDLLQMTQNLTETQRHLFAENFLVSVDAMVGDDQLNLSNPAHMQAITRQAELHGAEIIIVDTLAAGFVLGNENDNSEMSSKVIRPLQKLAKTTGAVVLLVHHIGKQGENQDSGKLFRGRGASALAAAARLVLDLDHMRDADKKVVRDHVLLHCAKVKGPSFEDTIFRLTFEERWFELAAVDAPRQDAKSDRIINLVSEPMKRGEVIAAGRQAGIEADDRTYERALKFAVGVGLLRRGPRATYEPTSLWFKRQGAGIAGPEVQLELPFSEGDESEIVEEAA